MNTRTSLFISVLSFHIEGFLLVNCVVEIGMDSLTVLLQMFLKLRPTNVGSEMADLPDGSPGPHVLCSLGKGVRGARGEHYLCCLLRLTLLTTTIK